MDAGESLPEQREYTVDRRSTTGVTSVTDGDHLFLGVAQCPRSPYVIFDLYFCVLEAHLNETVFV